MGLALYMVDAIIREHVYRAIAGDVLLIGRQTVYVTPDEALDLLRAHGVTPAIEPETISLDRDTLNQRSGLPPRPLISDSSLFALLGNRKVKALDHSTYEGAEVVHDLTTEVPEHLKGCADFIVDGSTLDNTFNPALTLKNYADLLRPGGRLVAANAFSNHHDPYMMASPTWFLDYFVMNRFVDCKVYVVAHRPDGVNVFCIDPECLLDPKRKVDNFKAPGEVAVIVVAEKGPRSTTSVWPTQAQYRSEQAWSTYRANLGEMSRSNRPHVMRSWGPGMTLGPVVSGYLFMDGQYAPRDPHALEVQRALDAAERRFEQSIAGRIERVFKQLARKAGYELVRTPEEKRNLRAVEPAPSVPRTLAGRIKANFLRLLQTAGYDLAKSPRDTPPNSRDRQP